MNVDILFTLPAVGNIPRSQHPTTRAGRRTRLPSRFISYDLGGPRYNCDVLMDGGGHYGGLNLPQAKDVLEKPPRRLPPQQKKEEKEKGEEGKEEKKKEGEEIAIEEEEDIIILEVDPDDLNVLYHEL
ncbi:hypothetical protein OUZ56_024072 [Daphnia magna]|uniref:Uncharacterized protein n=1 Tax=Daphnia magna TaxID=35525 RepID=A0ABR0B034_9CRUS|nr:hypothetical protein OUZ56_024072 [Daphnia magna]